MTTRPHFDRSRQSALYLPELHAPREATVIGNGGIGSPTALGVAKLGVPKMTLYDFDTVEEENLSNQWYRHKYAETPTFKSDALAEQIGEFADCKVVAVPERYVAQPLSGLVISGVDSMPARRRIWEDGIRFNPNIDLYIDGRMGGLSGRIISVRPADPDDVERYEETLHTDERTQEDPCGERAVMSNTLVMAGLITEVVRQWYATGRLIASVTFDVRKMGILALDERGRRL